MSNVDDPDRKQFSVYAFFANGFHDRVAEWLDAKDAIQAAKLWTESLTAQPGMIERVIVTDGGDNTVFEWIAGRGVTYPKPEQTS